MSWHARLAPSRRIWASSLTLPLRNPHPPSTMQAIRADPRAHGRKRGKHRYNAIAKHLTAAGHLTRASVFDDSTQRPTWVTRAYRTPANNQQHTDLGIAASEQIRPEEPSQEHDRGDIPGEVPARLNRRPAPAHGGEAAYDSGGRYRWCCGAT